MCSTPAHPERIPFRRDPVTADPHSEGWGRLEMQAFFQQEMSCLIASVAGLQEYLLSADQSTSRESRVDPIRCTQQLLHRMEHAYRLVDQLGVLAQPPEFAWVDVQKIALRAWENSHLATLPRDSQMLAESIPIWGDAGQLYLALFILMSERREHGRDHGLSSVFIDGRWELEISDNGEIYSEQSLGVRTARLVAQKHCGELKILRCPQGGVAFNFVFPQMSAIRRAA